MDCRVKPGNDARVSATLSVEEQSCEDHHLCRDTESDHPFQLDEFGLNFDQAAVDPGKTVTRHLHASQPATGNQ
jgi:hypothetical protein